MSDRLYRLLLRMYPPSFRRRFGEEMVRAHRDRRRRARRRGGAAPGMHVARTVLDVAVHAPLEWARRIGVVMGRLRATGGGGGMDGFRRDVVYGVRTLLRRPGFAVVALLTLGLGVGANTAVFSVVDGVLLQPLEMPDPGELAVVWQTDLESGRTRMDATGPDYLDWREMSSSFEGFTAIGGAGWVVTGDDRAPRRVQGGSVTADFFGVLGIRPVLGRPFRPEENEGEHRVAVISHGLWQARFGGAPDVIGRPLHLDGVAHEIVGVLPAVSLPLNLQTLVMTEATGLHVWVPQDVTSDWFRARTSHTRLVLGRLADGVSLEAARAEMAAIAASLAERHPETNRGIGVRVVGLHEQVVGDVRADLLLLTGAVGLVLLVACANLANLLLARSVDRQRELAVRTALGAGRGRLLRQATTEVGLLGLGGASAGLGVAYLGTTLLLRAAPDTLPRQATVGVDGRVLLFTLGVSLAAAAVAGLLPALRASRTDLHDPLRSGGRGATASAAGRRARAALVVSQLAVAVVLLVGAGLLGRTFLALRGSDPGARLEGVLSAEITLTAPRYDASGTVAFHQALLRRVRALPGVTGAVLTYDTPLESTWFEGFAVQGRPAPEPGEFPDARYRPVGAGYFELLDIPLVRGRTFEPSDDFDAPGAVVINRALAERYFHGEVAVGQRIEHGTPAANFSEAPEVWEIVGVVENVAFMGPRGETEPALYAPLGQFPVPWTRLLVRAGGDPAALAGAVREAIWALDPDIPVPELVSLETLASRQLAGDRFQALLVSLFALVALVVSAAGVYGVLSYAVASRTAEMGVRLAMGASPGRVRALLLGRGLRLAAVGLGVGLGGALVLARVLAGVLFGVRPWDPVVLGAVSGGLFLVATVAGWVPALRAARISPSEALRRE